MLSDIDELFQVKGDEDQGPWYVAYVKVRYRGWWDGLGKPSGRFIGRPDLQICTACGYASIIIRDAAAPTAPWPNAETCDGVAAASRPCPRCDGGYEIRLRQVFPGPRPLCIGRTAAPHQWLAPGEVGLVIARIRVGCGLMSLSLRDPGELPWGDLLWFSWVGDGRRCRRCGGAQVGCLRHAGDQTATIAQATVSWYTEGVGHLMAWVCRDCGHIDLAVRDAGAVPWPRVVGFAWIPGDRATS